jgi:hypothetical protein
MPDVYIKLMGLLYIDKRGWSGVHPPGHRDNHYRLRRDDFATHRGPCDGEVLVVHILWPCGTLEERAEFRRAEETYE